MHIGRGNALWVCNPSAGQYTSDSYEGDGYVIIRHPRSDVVEDALKHIVSLVKVV